MSESTHKLRMYLLSGETLEFDAVVSACDATWFQVTCPGVTHTFPAINIKRVEEEHPVISPTDRQRVKGRVKGFDEW